MNLKPTKAVDDLAFDPNAFPNLFIQSNTQSALTVNLPHAMDELAKHVAYIISECLGSNFTLVEASAAAEDACVDEIIGLARFNEEFQASCAPDAKTERCLDCN